MIHNLLEFFSTPREKKIIKIFSSFKNEKLNEKKKIYFWKLTFFKKKLSYDYYWYKQETYTGKIGVSDEYSYCMKNVNIHNVFTAHRAHIHTNKKSSRLHMEVWERIKYIRNELGICRRHCTIYKYIYYFMHVWIIPVHVSVHVSRVYRVSNCQTAWISRLVCWLSKMELDTDSSIPRISVYISVFSCLILSLIYVGSLYVWKSDHDRWEIYKKFPWHSKFIVIWCN